MEGWRPITPSHSASPISFPISERQCGGTRSIGSTTSALGVARCCVYVDLGEKGKAACRAVGRGTCIRGREVYILYRGLGIEPGKGFVEAHVIDAKIRRSVRDTFLPRSFSFSFAHVPMFGRRLEYSGRPVGDDRLAVKSSSKASASGNAGRNSIPGASSTALRCLCVSS